MIRTRTRWILLMAVVLAIAGCTADPGEIMDTTEEEGGESMQQPIEVIRAEGTQLDRRPQQTELATFALG